MRRNDRLAGLPVMARHLLALAFFLAVSAHARSLPDFADLVEKQGPAVVNVSTTQSAPERTGRSVPEDDPFYEFFRRFMPPEGQGVPRGHEARSLGSGFIVSADGYILTNAHVVDAASEITVRLTDKREFKAKVIGADKRTDVAVLKIEATNLPTVRLGDPNKLRVGEWVVAIGSPFGFENSVTAGIVSAKGRSLPQENYVPFIQTDVATNPGNSGGPLFNLEGEVIGINSQIYSRTGGFMGLAFAIPIDVAMDVGEQLRTSGRVTRGWLGVVIQEVTRELAESFGLPQPTGALISAVEKGGPAEKAGLEASDVVLTFDGKKVDSSSELPRLVGATRPGKPVTVQVWRRGATKDIKLTLGEMVQDKLAARSTPAGAKPPANKLGLSLAELPTAQKEQLGVDGGLLVEEVSGPAAKAGLRRGDVVLALNNHDVKSVEQFNQVLGQYESRSSVALLVKRGESSIYIPVKIDAK